MQVEALQIMADVFGMFYTCVAMQYFTSILAREEARLGQVEVTTFASSRK